MKRLTAVLLCLVLLLTACGDKPQEETRESYSGGGIARKEDYSYSVSLEAALQGEKYDLTPHYLCEEKQTLTITTYDGVNNNYLPPSNEEWFWQTLEEYTNVHIEWEVCSYSSYNEILNTRLASGMELSDIIMSGNSRATTNAGNNGLFVDMAQYWDSCFTNTSKYLETTGIDLLSLITNPNGQIYALPNIMNPTEGHITFLYNTAWLKELGKEVPTTLEEFTELLYAIRDGGDLNHNGVKDEVVLTSETVSCLMSVLGNAFGLEQYEGWDAFVADENGVVTAEYTSDNMRAALTYLAKLYKEGLLDNEICTMSADDMAEKIANDRVGIFVYYSGFAIGYGGLTTAGQEDALAEVYTLGLPLASEYNNNEGYFVRRTVAYGNTGASVTTECSDPELACKWLDTLYADPNILMIRCYGEEGNSWQYGEDGQVELILDEDGAWDTRYLGIGQISLPFIQTTEELLSDKLPYQWYLDEYEAMRNVKWISASVPKVSIYSEEEAELRDEVNSEVSDFWFEWRDQFVTGMKDIDTEWETYVKSINSMGLKQLEEVYQMVYDRLNGE